MSRSRSSGRTPRTKKDPAESRHPALHNIKFQPAFAHLPAVLPSPEPSAIKTMLATDRRNVAARQALVLRVRSEFAEMPGLSLTLLQATRLFGISREACARILVGLSDESALRVTADGRYVLGDKHP